MIEIVKKDLMSQDFKTALIKVSTCSKFDPKVSYRVMRTTKVLESEFRKVQKEFVDVIKGIAKLDLKGNPILNESKTDYEFIDGVDINTAKATLEAFGSGTIKIDRDRFELEELSAAGLTPADLAMLEPLFNQPEN